MNTEESKAPGKHCQVVSVFSASLRYELPLNYLLIISAVRHYIKIEVPLQAQTKDRKILTSLQTSVTILLSHTRTEQGDSHRVTRTISPWIIK